jgi:hypothetical protein
MSGNHIAVLVNQDGNVETQGTDTFGQKPDLPVAVFAGIIRVGFQ